MLFIWHDPVDITITEVSGTQHEIKKASRISIDHRNFDQFTIRVESYAMGDKHGVDVKCVLSGLINWKEFQRIQRIFENEYKKRLEYRDDIEELP
ncbi:MAG: hypothetical protein OXU27_12205 [Candidatus Poribacteria bacterium]|nr:hypothetical protein [Candidatus Poribacteria bacterium]MDE0325593.1 hypothetical protein [Candidatus Poribacteria bacterium]